MASAHSVSNAEGDKSGDLTGTVAKHYNELHEGGLEDRVKSRIFYQRNFNNWIKSMSISDILTRIKQRNGYNKSITVLDLCSGKGGDLLKWKKGEIDHLICADIAGTSVEQCEVRYKEMQERSKHERGRQKNFTAQFITADCTKQRLRDLYADPDMTFDLTSCQFSFHYSFESLPQAEMMLQNACERLKPGGYFIGTLPNAYELIKRWRAAEGSSFSNEVYEISFESEDKQNVPLFGAKYHFRLEGVVDCPEFVVHFPLLEKMAEKYNMKLVFKSTFADFFQQKVQDNDGRGLIGRMQGLEPYPPDDDVELMSKDEKSYANAKKYWTEKQSSAAGDNERRRPVKVGTLSQAEWEASTIYLVFAFQRLPDSANDSVATASNERVSLKRKLDTSEASSS